MTTAEILRRLGACEDMLRWAEKHPDPLEAWRSTWPANRRWVAQRACLALYGPCCCGHDEGSAPSTAVLDGITLSINEGWRP